jgi:hypothetical protein
MRCARIWRWTRMRPWVERCSGPVPSSRSRSCPGYTIITSGYDFRKGHRLKAASDSYPTRPAISPMPSVLSRSNGHRGASGETWPSMYERPGASLLPRWAGAGTFCSSRAQPDCMTVNLNISYMRLTKCTGRVMCTVMVTCPTTGKSISTGIETDRITFDQLPNVLSHSRCPHCGIEHPWWTREAWLSDREGVWSPGSDPPQGFRPFSRSL